MARNGDEFLVCCHSASLGGFRPPATWEFGGLARVDLRYSGSDWIAVVFSLSDDRAFVVELVEEAADAHRPPPGVTPKPPPTGPELERRRRFH